MPGSKATGLPDCDGASVFQIAARDVGAKQYSQAVAILNRFKSCPSRSPLDSFQLGWMYGRARRFDAALEVFESLPRDVPDRPTHDYALALSNFELGRYQKVIGVLNDYRSAGTADAKTVNLLAVSYSKLGQFRDAYDVLSSFLQRNGPDLTSYLNLVTVCAEGGDIYRAGDVAVAARQAYPGSADVWIIAGAAETMLGRLDEAAKDFSQGAKIAPDRGDARFFLALVDYKQARFTDAIGILRAALNDGIADSDLHYLMAECLQKTEAENTNAAIKELNEAIRLNTDSVAARTLRGKLLLDTGHAREAIADLEFARGRNPHSRSTLYNLARAYRASGDETDARNLFRTFRSGSEETLSEASEARLNDALAGKTGQRP